MNGFEPDAHCEGTRNRFHKIPTPSGRAPQTERHRKRRCPTAGSKARTIDTAFGHGRPPICFLSRQLESYRGGPCPPFYLDAIPLSKCARNCTLPRPPQQLRGGRAALPPGNVQSMIKRATLSKKASPLEPPKSFCIARHRLRHLQRWCNLCLTFLTIHMTPRVNQILKCWNGLLTALFF